MVKKYITGETKEQRKARKALEKAQRSVENVKTLPPESVEIVQSLPPKSVDKKYYVLCLKHGMKYSSDYVNKQSPQAQYLDVNNYIYDSNFKNEIRPALDYFSRSEKLVAPDVDADRPNHIKDMNVHNRIYNAVHSLISGERTGIIDIA